MEERGNGLMVDGISMKTTNSHAVAQQDVENTIDINELKRRIERRDAENKRKDREVILLQKEILTLTKDMQDLRDRNESLQSSLTNARLLTNASREQAENQFGNTIIQDLQKKLEKLEHKSNEVLGENEVNKATIRTLREQLVESLSTSEVRAKEIQSMKEENYSLNIKLKTIQIRLQEKDVEYEKLKVINESFVKSERQLKHQLEHEKTVTYEHERTINDLLATNKRIMAANIIKSETNQFLSTELNEIQSGGGGGGGVVSGEELATFKEIEKQNRILLERNKELTKSIELHMDLLQRSESENNILKMKIDEESSLREELQAEMKSTVDHQHGKDNTFQQLKKEVVKLRKENKILAEKCDELMRQKQSPQQQQQQQHSHGTGAGTGARTGTGQSYGYSNGQQQQQQQQQGSLSLSSVEDRKKLKLSEETVKALRNRISFLLEQLSHLSQQSTAWNEQKLVFKSQLSSLLEANVSLRERLLTVQRSFMERSLYELDHPAVRRNARPVFLTEGEEERVLATGQWEDQNQGNDLGGGTRGPQSSQYSSPEEAMEGAIVSHNLPPPLPMRGGLSQDPKAREARLLEFSMRSELGQPLPFSVEGIVERTLFDTLCAFTSGTRSSSASSGTASESKQGNQQVMKPKVQKSYVTSVGTDGLYSILLESGQYAHISSQADMAIRAEAEELLTGLQIPAFLKFVQTRPTEKFVPLFTEKVLPLSSSPLLSRPHLSPPSSPLPPLLFPLTPSPLPSHSLSSSLSLPLLFPLTPSPLPSHSLCYPLPLLSLLSLLTFLS
jgi:hypothetical protein